MAARPSSARKSPALSTPVPLRGDPGKPDAQLEFLGQAFTMYGANLARVLRLSGAAADTRSLVAVGRQVQLELEVRTARQRPLLGFVAQCEPVAADVVYVAQAQLRVAVYFRFTPYSRVHHLLQSDVLRLRSEMGDSQGWGQRTERWLESTFAPRRVCEKLHAMLEAERLFR